MKSTSLPQRQIHLDFHTSPAIPGIGADFDAREFARTMKRAHVNSVTVFAKCGQGHLYYNTRHPARHPGLRKGHDLLAKQIEALHRENIRAPIYISVLFDGYAARAHPGWLVVNPDNTRWTPKPLEPGWDVLDMSSPYQEFLVEQTAEVLRKFRPVDGIFFDICWDQPSVSVYALAAMRKAGLDPTIEAHRIEHARRVSAAYMKRFSLMVKATAPRATVYYNSRPLAGLPQDVRHMTHVEIEALATGGWGYLYFPKNVRFARNFNRPYMGMTARFHRSWGDFGGYKPRAALQFEVCQMLAHGAQCSIGDQLHPRGRLDKAAYELIGSVYAHAEACEPWTADAKPVTEIAVLRTGIGYQDAPGSANDGVTRMLTQLKLQFDLVDVTSNLDPYELVIVPDGFTIQPEHAKLLRGRRLLIAGDPKSLSRDAGVKVIGESPFTTTYFRLGKDATDHAVYERGWRMKPTAGATTLARVVEPYFERTWEHFCSHFQTPPLPKPGPYAAAIRKRNIITIAFPVFRSYATHGNLPYRQLVSECINALLPNKLVEVTGPSTLEVTVMRQRDRTIVHLLHFVAERRTQTLDLIEDIVPLFDVPLSLRLASKPKQVYLAPQKSALDWDYNGGRVTLKVPRVDGHAMVVFEGATP